MDYQIIKPPSYKPFSNMTKLEADRYFSWYLSVINTRIEILEKLLQNDSDEVCRGWVANKSANSLSVLGKWLQQQVGFRKRTDEDIASFGAKLKPSLSNIWVSEVTLDERTFSLSIDIGMYFGETLRNNLKNIKWDVFLKNKKNVYYNHVVLTGFSLGYICNPTQIVVMFAYNLGWGKANTDELEIKFHNWSKVVDI
ncbi:MAG: hypothetical protein MUF87_11000 [Anaerolineae bacterium]|nr:hypothetical protein [Anaerolineae bacterium]